MLDTSRSRALLHRPVFAQILGYLSRQERKAQINRVCKKAEVEIEEEFTRKERRAIFKIKCIGSFIAFVFVVATIISFLTQTANTLKLVIRKIKCKLRQEKFIELDRRRENIYIPLIQ